MAAAFPYEKRHDGCGLIHQGASQRQRRLNWSQGISMTYSWGIMLPKAHRPHPEEARSAVSKRMAAGSVSLVAFLRDARSPSRRAPQVGHARLRMTCALLRTRSMIRNSETQYYGWRGGME